eukprot:264099_1
MLFSNDLFTTDDGIHPLISFCAMYANLVHSQTLPKLVFTCGTLYFSSKSFASIFSNVNADMMVHPRTHPFVGLYASVWMDVAHDVIVSALGSSTKCNSTKSRDEIAPPAFGGVAYLITNKFGFALLLMFTRSNDEKT